LTAPGLIIAAPSTGSGKTLVTLGLLRALARRGVAVTSAKVGPDYIDPAFHAAASGRPCLNLDGWAMRPGTLAGLAGRIASGADLVVCEGVMGLFDGANVAAGPDGSTADLAALSGWPVLLVVDVRGQAGSAAALLRGFAAHRPDVRVAGVVFNRLGGEAHRQMLLRACVRHLPELAVLGLLPRADELELPSRHLGLVQACERPDLDAFIERAADLVTAHLDLDRLFGLARPGRWAEAPAPVPLPPLGQRIAVACDAAFAFCYAAVAEGWRSVGAELSFFSPLADEAPEPGCDAVYLPGGYPELHAGRLAAAARFMSGLRDAAERGAAIYGECGGYMVLGESLTDAAGAEHRMGGLLPLRTSLAQKRLHLGYRQGTLAASGVLGDAGQRFRGHEFHYATVLAEGPGQPLLHAADAAGAAVGPMGLCVGRVAGSFLHLVDRA
jgi:cobyrinic acid a,c-diamide synthase